MFNKVTLVGRLGKDPELGDASGKPYCKISLATNESWKGQDGERHDRTDWHSITIWGRSAEYVASRAVKGSLVLVEGQLRNRTWNDKDGNSRKAVEVNVNLSGTVKILDGAKAQEQPHTTQPTEKEDLPF